MTVYTPILRLVVPAFDQNPWDQDMNSDLYVIDAAIGKFFGVANLQGIWKHSTSYTIGQSVVDSDDGSMWTCATNNTSAPAGTFAQDRSNNPSYWTRITSSAQDYAIQSAQSANAAQTSASAAANSATSAGSSAAVVAGALPLSGGTMTGPIILAADPTNVRGAATKQYVDARVGGTGFLPITGGTLSGPLILNANPSAPLGAATKQYVDAAVGNYLPLAGGTLAGTLTVGGAGVRYSARGTHYFSFDWTGQLVAYVDGANVGPVALGSYLPMSGGTLSGNLAVPNQYSISATGARFYSDSTYTILYEDTSNWCWVYARATGETWYQRGSDGAQLYYISPSGNTITTGWMASYNGVLPSYSATDFIISRGGGVRNLQFATGYGLVWYEASGDLVWDIGGTIALWYPTSDRIFRNMLAPMAGNGAYINLSDASVKSDPVPCPYGMPEVRSIAPKKYTRTGMTDAEIGFIAQEVQPYVPEAIQQFDAGLLGISSDMLGAVAWNALKQLDARVTALEAK